MNEITIRAFEMADWEDAAELFLAPKCQWGTLQMPYQSRDKIKQKLEAASAPDIHRLVAILSETGKVVRMIGLHLTGRERRAHVGYIGMSVLDDYQGQGIGSKLMEAILDLADNWLNLKRIELTVYTDNPGAVHLYQKYGFEIEGTMRKFAFRAGTYVDAYAMARLRD